MGKKEKLKGYHDTRFSFDPKREILWQTLVRFYFQKEIFPNATVLELGTGYGHFINNVRCQNRFAADVWPGARKYLKDDVRFICGNAWQLSSIREKQVDYVFASNLFEHISKEKLAMVVAVLRRKMKPGGKLVILQPNFYYAYREYFDDFTHKTIYTHTGLSEYLNSLGLITEEMHPRFLPLSVKSRLPVHPLLIRLYLSLPFKFMGKQMLIKMRFP